MLAAIARRDGGGKFVLGARVHVEQYGGAEVLRYCGGIFVVGDGGVGVAVVATRCAGSGAAGEENVSCLLESLTWEGRVRLKGNIYYQLRKNSYK